ncbi:MAG: divalent-cation tolerance protein CutA [Microthrixaceae bacterium]
MRNSRRGRTHRPAPGGSRTHFCCVAVWAEQKRIYRWKGAVEEGKEWGLTIKTTRGLFAELRRELCRMHSYEVPELLALPVVDGNADYLEWMEREVKKPAE